MGGRQALPTQAHLTGRSSLPCLSWVPAWYNHPVLISWVQGRAEAKPALNPLVFLLYLSNMLGLSSALLLFPVHLQKIFAQPYNGQPAGACSTSSHLQLVAAWPLLSYPHCQLSGLSYPFLLLFLGSEVHQVSAPLSSCSSALEWVVVVPLMQSL